ncbi:MAG TPA: sigma-70 family RNA polymerase sigma factor [Bryobacteraceae bacterium]
MERTSGKRTMLAVSISASMDEPRLRQQWITQAKAGDAVAFERILEAHSGVVLRLAQRLLLNEADAADAAQEVFIRLHRSLSKVDAERGILPWIYRMTMNVCHDFRRARKPSVSISGVAEPVNPAATPEELVDAQERRRMMFDALATLTEREREAIVLRDLEGLTTEEVAELAGTSPATIRSQISMGRVKLKNYVAQKLKRDV